MGKAINGSQNDEPEGSNPDLDSFDDDVTLLQSYSLSTISTDGSTFEMHPLVQLCSRRWLTARNLKDEWFKVFIERMSECFPNGEFETWSQCHALFPHIHPYISTIPNIPESLCRSWSKLLVNAAWYLQNIGKINQAKGVITATIEVQERLTEPTSLVFRNKRILTQVLIEQGRFLGAETVLGGAIEGSNDALEPANCRYHTIDLRQQLGYLAYLKGNNEEVGTILRQVLESRGTVLRPNSRLIMDAMSSLGLVLRAEGESEKAEKMMRDLLKAQTEVYGVVNPNTLKTLLVLDSALRDQEHFQEAEFYHRGALNLAKDLLGEEHSYKFICMNNLAVDLAALDKLDEAESLHQQELLTVQRR
ncbi:hypothetical protein MKZ38_002558 [Zalerion maritima]|uniref:Uncharacterized protein n=1 Tax=Zalerion maritima TaxID=339359 RepID=A0AAD5RVK1_9PEZI|nr:hypothetical protein MKZ38_002558 [Zalerion maritima]